MKSLTDTAPDPDEVPDVTVPAERGSVTYTARFVGLQLIELTLKATAGQVTTESVRNAPMSELRTKAVAEVRRRALLLPRDIDRDLMLVDRDIEGGPSSLMDVVMALAIAEQLSPDRPVEFFAEHNHIGRATAFRWKKAAADAGILTPNTKEVALSFWRQMKEREARNK